MLRARVTNARVGMPPWTAAEALGVAAEMRAVNAFERNDSIAVEAERLPGVPVGDRLGPGA